MANDKDFKIKNGLTVDSDTLVVDAGNSRVGIGTTNPATPLEVYGQMRSSSSATNYGDFNGLSGALYISHRNGANDGSILFGGAGGGTFTEKMRLTPDGKLGIGSSAPTEALEVVSKGQYNPAIRIEDWGDSAGGAGVGWSRIDLSHSQSTSSEQGIIYVDQNMNFNLLHKDSGRDIIFKTTPAGTGGSSIESLRIRSDGSVGICGSVSNAKVFIKDSSAANGQSGLYVDRDITDVTQDNQYGARILTDVYGSSTLDADYKYSYGIYNQSTNYATGFNDTTDRNYHYGIFNQAIVDSVSTVRDNTALYSTAYQYYTGTSIKINNIAVNAQAQNFAGSLTSQHGLYGFSGIRNQSTVTNSHGVYGESQIYPSGGSITNAYGAYFQVDLNTPDTVTYPGATNTAGGVYGVRSYINNRTGSTITGNTFAFRGQLAGSGTYAGKYGVYVNGETTNRGDVGWTTGSDIRIKENIENITDAVDKVKQIRGVTYNRIGNDVREAGVIAQELEVVLPEAVVEFDPDPEDDDDRTLKGVTYDRITALLIEAIKEQQTTIEALEARLTALEST